MKYDNLKVARLQDIGCLACYIEGHPGTPGDLHHPTVAGRRLGDDIFFVLCPLHHRSEAKGAPSLAKSKKAFVERYGTEQELLALSERLYREKYE